MLHKHTHWLADMLHVNNAPLRDTCWRSRWGALVSPPGAGNAPPFLHPALTAIGSCQSFSALLLPIPVPVSKDQQVPAALRKHFLLCGSMTTYSLAFVPPIHRILISSAISLSSTCWLGQQCPCHWTCREEKRKGQSGFLSFFPPLFLPFSRPFLLFSLSMFFRDTSASCHWHPALWHDTTEVTALQGGK